MDQPILFVNPLTGEGRNIAPRRRYINAAIKLGFIPFSRNEEERVEEILERPWNERAGTDLR